MTNNDLVMLNSLPMTLRWQPEPKSWQHHETELRVQSGPLTDLFVDPQGKPPKLNAPRLLGETTGDFTLSARITVDFASAFDAGVLVLYADAHNWAKLCFEYSPHRQPMVVSVVTHGVSDDCNSLDVDGSTVWLRMARIGQAYAFHASADGERWRVVRQFGLDGAPSLGFSAQSPTGETCAVTFDQIRFTTNTVADLRDGS
jgi:uncharacterized protein